MIELLCPPQTARTALAKCLSGEISCMACKDEHVLDVVNGLLTVITPPARAGQSPSVRDSVVRAVDGLYRPPPREASGIELLLAGRAGVDPRQVVVGHGSTEVMDWLFHRQAQSGGTVIATEPTFELYKDLADRHQLWYIGVPWDKARLGHDIAALIDTISDDTVLCVLDIPHAVSVVASATDDMIGQLAQALPGHAVLLLDMVYADFMDSKPYHPVG